MDRKNNNTRLIIWATLPGLVTAFILGLMFWDPVEVFRVAIVTFAGILVTIISFSVFAVFASKGPTVWAKDPAAEDISSEMPDTAGDEDQEEEEPADTDRADGAKTEQEEHAQPQPHWSETAYPDPDVELGLKKTDQ